MPTIEQLIHDRPNDRRRQDLTYLEEMIRKGRLSDADGALMTEVQDSLDKVKPGTEKMVRIAKDVDIVLRAVKLMYPDDDSTDD